MYVPGMLQLARHVHIPGIHGDHLITPYNTYVRTPAHMLLVTPCSPIGVGHGQLVHVREQSLPVMESERERPGERQNERCSGSHRVSRHTAYMILLGVRDRWGPPLSTAVTWQRQRVGLMPIAARGGFHVAHRSSPIPSDVLNH